MKAIKVFCILWLIIQIFNTHSIAQSKLLNPWFDIHENNIAEVQERITIPRHYRVLKIDLISLGDLLKLAPMEFSEESKLKETVLILPIPDGSFQQFRILESPIVAPELAAKFPKIRTYSGQGIDDPTATCRLGITHAGFHAIIFSTLGTIYIDPYAKGDTTHYINYFKRDAQWFENRGLELPTCILELDPLIAHQIASLIEQGVVESIGAELRTYRAAVAATGEYTQFHGGTVALGLSAVVTALNRVNGIYEREVAIRMSLVSNNDEIIYTNPNTDPYTNNDNNEMLAENQTNLDTVIGDDNYDIGHVFGTGSGGIATLGVVCRTELKARGVTGQSQPIGDPFYVDYVAHEIGHQFGANHSFNGNAGSCSGQRNASTAYEPGSGSTIMAYAGICGTQNLQLNSHDYFHRISIDQIVAYSTAGLGNSCPTITQTGNSPPTVDAGPSGYTIPINTPFFLTGSGSDPDSDPLTFCWEQYDLGPAGHPNSPSGNAPIFRSFPAVSSPTRTFPQLSDILNNTQTIGEILPSYSRTLTFRLTARDNRSGGGGKCLFRNVIECNLKCRSICCY